MRARDCGAMQIIIYKGMQIIQGAGRSLQLQLAKRGDSYIDEDLSRAISNLAPQGFNDGSVKKVQDRRNTYIYGWFL